MSFKCVSVEMIFCIQKPSGVKFLLQVIYIFISFFLRKLRFISLLCGDYLQCYDKLGLFKTKRICCSLVWNYFETNCERFLLQRIVVQFTLDTFCGPALVNHRMKVVDLKNDVGLAVRKLFKSVFCLVT